MHRSVKQLLLAAALTGVTAHAFSAEHTIEMKNSGADGAMVFEPGFVKAEPGDTIKFVLADQAHNTVSVAVPDGAEGWEGAINEEVTVTLDEEGVYVFNCTPHAPLNMAGVIQVGEATNLDEAQAAVDELTSAAATNKDRLQGYLDQVE